MTQRNGENSVMVTCHGSSIDSSLMNHKCFDGIRLFRFHGSNAVIRVESGSCTSILSGLHCHVDIVCALLDMGVQIAGG